MPGSARTHAGDELPEELRRRESRLAKIREAKQALEDEARERAEQEARKRAATRGEGEDTTAQRVADAVAAAVPKPKAQRNFTDPQSRIMKTSDGSFHQCFNAQAVVDDGHQVIVAAEVTDCAADVANLMPMTEQATLNAGHAPGEVLADAGYCSADNLEQAATVSAASGGPSSSSPPAAPSTTCRSRPRRGAGSARDATPRERMARKTHHQEGPDRLRPTQGHRGTGVRADGHPAERENTSCSAGSTAPAASGSCSRPATTYANCTVTSASLASPGSRPPDPPPRGHESARQRTRLAPQRPPKGSPAGITPLSLPEPAKAGRSRSDRSTAHPGPP
jgi:hypothetical protein